MNRRKRASGGQAIVMVTLALFSMVGMMGLAVDLGWSYFAQKQAQAAADTAALAAAQEAVARLGTSNQVSGFSCGTTLQGSIAGEVQCTEFSSSAVLDSCGSITTTSNLYSACLYAKRNGFQNDASGSKQSVTVQAGDVLDNNRPPNVNRISYWVRVRTVQFVPQLFVPSREPARDRWPRTRPPGIARSDRSGIVLRYGPGGRLLNWYGRRQLWPGLSHRPRQRQRQRRFATMRQHHIGSVRPCGSDPSFFVQWGQGADWL